MTSMNAARIKLSILQSLKDTHPFLLPDSTLFADTNLRLSQPITLSEFRSMLNELESNRRVVSQRDEDDNLKWKITDNGLARLMELL